ncbi:MAG: ABC transporter ATP-binding protein [Gammaproteobacteria bacterium]|jgi:iron(III) transport system ATP-binding protein|nr:ABC transporter ATP-binding protein [Gammaproteobacteria bacterium]|tara:strand:+ start:49 stop:1107 length:1059 start_codon:yes stop_codon:yes gene_type:complete
MNKKLIISDLSLVLENNKDKSKVLTDVNFDLDESEIGCILGPSGCGKTSLLRAIAGFENINSGSILKDGVCISNSLENTSVQNRKMGMVFQDYALFPNMDVKTNIAFGLKDATKKEKEDRVNYLLELVSLEQYKDKYPHELSGGEQQRVALIRALAPSPDVLLLDEPFSNIDADIKEELVTDVRDLLKELSITSIIVTHDQYEAFNIADKVAIMNNGKVEQVGNAYDIYHKPINKFVADFIGLGVFIPITRNQNGELETPLGLIEKNKLPQTNFDSKDLEMLLRPDDIIHNDESDTMAVVVEKQFRGAEFLYKLLYNDQYPLLCFAPSHHNHKIGESIGIQLEMEHYVIFEK